MWAGASLVVAIGACSSLPRISPDLQRQTRTPVQIEGARGALSAAQSKAVIDRLEKGGQPTELFDRHLAVEEAIAGSPLTTGNDVRLLQDGPATYQAMVHAI
jgi:cardiolipin synthase